MTPIAINVVVLLVLILPGFLSYKFAVLRRADPSQRSYLWQLSEIVEHSVYVHLLGVGLVAAAHFLLQQIWGLSSYAPILFQEGPTAFLKSHFAEAVLWFSLYPVYVIIFSAIIGAYGLPGQVSAKIVAATQQITGWVASRGKLLSWMPVPKSAHPQEPVWYYAFNVMSGGYTSKMPHVLVTLKSGDIYYGAIASYPITPDTEQGKDFLIRDAIYYKGGFADSAHRLYEVDGIGAALLNTANVDSLVLYYADTGQLETEPPG